MATVEVLLSKSSEACQWMVQYLVSPEGREITRFASFICRRIRDVEHVFSSPKFIILHLFHLTISHCNCLRKHCVSVNILVGLWPRVHDCGLFITVPVICDTSMAACPF